MRSGAALLAGTLALGCGGGVPLMHPAHAVARDEVTFGAGFSGTAIASTSSRDGSPADAKLLESGSVSPSLAPWVGARLGFGAGADAGLLYTGRAARLDARQVVALSPSWDLFAGLGAVALLPRRDGDLGLRVGGFGGDVPLVVGWRSAGEIYSVWLGARGGGELLRGQRELSLDPSMPERVATEAVRGWHGWAGGLVGLRIGFRHVFAVLELDAAMHWSAADVAARHVATTGFAFAPAGALVSRF